MDPVAEGDGPGILAIEAETAGGVVAAWVAVGCGQQHGEPTARPDRHPTDDHVRLRRPRIEVEWLVVAEELLDRVGPQPGSSMTSRRWSELRAIATIDDPRAPLVVS